MDLDKIKKAWQETQSRPAIDNNKIQRMLDNSKESAFNKLLRYERIGLIIGFLLIPLSLSFRDKTLFLIFYLSSLFIGIAWQTYKYSFLKNIDFSNSSIIKIYQQITVYRRYIARELLIAIIWGAVATTMFCFFIIHPRNLYSPEHEFRVIAALSVWMIIVFIISFILYKKLFVNNIKKIEESIREIEEFGENNKKIKYS